MRIINHLFSAGICCIMAAFLYADGAMASTPLSKYGQIQNVQNYSTNPFWSPNGPYNQRVVPQPVYATGPDVETEDCQTVVGNLIAAQCGLENNCATTRLNEIRPIIMMQLSRMPGHNYATACAGYIDAAFDLYKEKFSNAAPSGTQVPFPAATAPSPIQTEATIPDILPTPPIPKWKQEMLEREQELQNLQAQNGASNEQVVRADFPKTAADLSFTDRLINAHAGYEVYANADAYLPINVEKRSDQLARLTQTAQQQKELNDINGQLHSGQNANASAAGNGNNQSSPAQYTPNDPTPNNDNTHPSQNTQPQNQNQETQTSPQTETNYAQDTPPSATQNDISIVNPHMQINLCQENMITVYSVETGATASAANTLPCANAIATYLGNQYNMDAAAFITELINGTAVLPDLFLKASDNDECKKLFHELRDVRKITEPCIGIAIDADSASGTKYQFDYNTTPNDVLLLIEGQ